VKVAAGDRFAGARQVQRPLFVEEDERVVGHGVDLAGQHALDMAQRVEHRAEHCRGSAQTVRVLRGAFGWVEVHIGVTARQGAALQQAVDKAGNLGLPFVAAHGVQVRQESVAETAQRLDRQRQRDLSGGQRMEGIVPGQRANSGADRRAVDQGHALLRAEFQAGNARRSHGLRPVQQCAPPERLAVRAGVRLFARQRRAEHQRQVRQRREIAGRAERSLGGHGRHHAPVEHGHQRVDHRPAHATVALGQRVGADEHGRAHRVRRQVRPGADGVAEQQVAAELRCLLRVAEDGPPGIVAEAGVHAVDGARGATLGVGLFDLLHRLADPGGAALDPRQTRSQVAPRRRRLRQRLDRGTLAGDAHDVADGQGALAQGQRARRMMA